MPAGTVIAGCRIEAVAGRGGMGVVYRATQLALGRTVAIKLIADDRAQVPAFRERFEREARLAAAISHPNVVAVHAAGEDDGRLYLLMEHIAGTDLHALIAEHGRLDPGRTAGIVAQLAAALDAAHEAGLVHRDVKPGNALVCGERVYLGDFGLTRLAASETELTQAGDWIGTVDFTSPEHLRGERCDARADVYALGCVLFAALVGRPPFPRGTVTATMLAHLNEPPPRVSSLAPVPEAFDAVVARALAKEPGDRYPSAGDLGRAALAAAAGARSPRAERTVARGDAAARPPTAATRSLSGDGRPPTAATRLAHTEVMGAQDPPTAATRHAYTEVAGRTGGLWLRSRDDTGDPARRSAAGAGAAAAGSRAPGDGAAGAERAAAAGPWTPRDGADPRIPRQGADGAGTSTPPGGVPRAGDTGVWTPRGEPAGDGDGDGAAAGRWSSRSDREAARRRRRPLRRLVTGLLAAVLVAGAGLAAAGVIGMRTGGAAQGASQAPVTAVDVRTAVERFAAAVAEEDDAALSRVLSPGVKRVFPTDAQTGRRTVLAAYRSQFAAGRVEAYEVTGLEAEGGEAGRATGRYRLEVAGRRPVTGEIVFGVVRDRGHPRIGLVAATPD